MLDKQGPWTSGRMLQVKSLRQSSKRWKLSASSFWGSWYTIFFWAPPTCTVEAWLSHLFVTSASRRSHWTTFSAAAKEFGSVGALPLAPQASSLGVSRYHLCCHKPQQEATATANFPALQGQTCLHQYFNIFLGPTLPQQRVQGKLLAITRDWQLLGDLGRQLRFPDNHHTQAWYRPAVWRVEASHPAGVDCPMGRLVGRNVGKKEGKTCRTGCRLSAGVLRRCAASLWRWGIGPLQVSI